MTAQSSRRRAVANGQCVFALGQNWPVAVVDLAESSGWMMIPETLWLLPGDYITLDVADQTDLPIYIELAERDYVRFVFEHSLHPSVVAALGYGADCAEEQALAA